MRAHVDNFLKKLHEKRILAKNCIDNVRDDVPEDHKMGIKILKIRNRVEISFKKANRCFENIIGPGNQDGMRPEEVTHCLKRV